MSSQPSTPAPLPRPRVLAVDDQPDSLRLLKLRLGAAGMDCLEFSESQKALDFLSESTVDLIILDVMMPGIDGFEMCRRIKADERLRDIPVLFLTAKMQTEDKVAGLEAGAHDYLSKPVNQAELLARTRAALRVKRLQDQLKNQLVMERQLSQLQQGMMSEHWLKTFGQLAGSLAHEINNPLTVAMGALDLMSMNDQLSTTSQSHLQLLQDSLARAGNRLRSLLLIAQPNREPRVLELNSLVEDIATVINSQVLMEKIHLEVSLMPGCRWFGDPGQLARAILYVLNNAMEAAGNDGKGRVRIQLATSGKEHVIRVSDNGPGIPIADQPRIFEPFFTTKAGDHHGVGLYLAAQIIQESGGRITVESPAADGNATTIEIHVPTA